MPSNEIAQSIRMLMEWAALAIEAVAVIVIVLGVVAVTIRRGIVRHPLELATPEMYRSYRHQLGPPLLLGLDFLVAGDVVKTVALEPTLENVAALGLLVVIRTFLSWAVILDAEGHWPWQSPKHAEVSDASAVRADATAASRESSSEIL